MVSFLLLPMCAAEESSVKNGIVRPKVIIVKMHSTISLPQRNGLLQRVIRSPARSPSVEVRMPVSLLGQLSRKGQTSFVLLFAWDHYWTCCVSTDLILLICSSMNMARQREKTTSFTCKLTPPTTVLRMECAIRP